MAKEKSLKLGSNPPKRKKLGSDAGVVHAEETMGAEVKKKRKKMQVEVSSTVPCTCFRQYCVKYSQNTEPVYFTQEVPVQIPQQTNTAHDKKQKREKKRKKNQVTEQTQTKQNKVRTLTAEDVSL